MIRLSDIAEVLSGVSPDLSANEVPFVQIKDLSFPRRPSVWGRKPTVARAKPVQVGDVLLASRGERTLAIVAGLDVVGSYATLDVYLIRPDLTRLDPTYLAAFLNRSETGALLRSTVTGSQLPRIPKDALSALGIPLPPMNVQQAVGGLASAHREHRNLLMQLADRQADLAEKQLELAFRAITKGAS